MYFKTAVVFSLLTSALALPAQNMDRITRRAVLSAQDYSQFQVSGGVGGNALAEVQAKFPINVANVDAADLAILKKAGQVAESAETQAGGFNEAIEAAGGTKTTAGKALQVGKIKNKVLKLQLSVLVLQAQIAAGEDRAAKLAEQTTKLSKNIQLDEAAAGQKSTSVDFQGSSQP
ncbi:hypothetical protein B0H67DRAFT_548931 [Lasiosphaeris hirsuta]|uniref:Small secreted protein n=1 Tax=Lasiosphaeris hirsuta TaxID=260670 RepID=A0AA40BBC4_9PEZI|nr:hypothetical protein B0H67DRAFT_548931 [Lasiosphaeris hirsuta]